MLNVNIQTGICACRVIPIEMALWNIESVHVGYQSELTCEPYARCLTLTCIDEHISQRITQSAVQGSGQVDLDRAILT